MTFANPKIRSCKPLTKTVNLSAWELDCLGWLLVVCGLGMWGDVVSVCPRAVWAAEPWPKGVTCGIDSLFGVLDGIISRRVTFAHLKRQHGYWALANYDYSISWRMNTLKYHDFHDETIERKACPCCCLCCCFPHCLENVSTNINQNSCDEIT